MKLNLFIMKTKCHLQGIYFVPSPLLPCKGLKNHAFHSYEKIWHVHFFLFSSQHIHYVSNKHFSQLLEFLKNFFKHSGEVLTKLWIMFSWILCVKKKHLTYKHAFPLRQYVKAMQTSILQLPRTAISPRYSKYDHATVSLKNKISTV